MKNNATYTALEILEATGQETFSVGEESYTSREVFGKVGITIGGIRGIVDPEKVISVTPGTEALDVMVGANAFTLPLEPNDGEKEHSDAARAAKAGK